MNYVTFALGIYSILMISLLPGAIFLKCLRISFLHRKTLFLPLCFGLSLFINYLLVMILTLSHSYTTRIIHIIAILEGLGFIFFYAKHFKSIDLPAQLHSLKQNSLLFWLACLCLLVYTLFWLHSFGYVFGMWDPTVWYNRWAFEWAQNNIPTLTWHYPQLLPTNWSLSYVLLGTLPQGIHLETFPAFIQGFFLIGLFLFLLHAFYHKRDQSFLLSILLLGIGLAYYYPQYLFSGYADIPVSFFNFGAIILFLLNDPEASDTHFYTRFSLFFAIAAALTKPAGIYTAIAIPLLFYFQKPSSLKTLLYRYLIMLALILPWYLYASLHETDHKGLSDLFFLIHEIFKTQNTLNNILTLIIFGWAPCLMLGSAFLFKEVLSPRLKAILYAYTPYFFIWLFFFSYDARNLIFLWPVAILLACITFCHHPLFSKNFMSFLKRVLQKFPLWILPLGFVSTILAFSYTPQFSKLSLINQQINQKNVIYYDSNVTLGLYTYSVCPGFQGKILTDYALFTDLPMLMPYIIPFSAQNYGNDMEPNVFSSLQNLRTFMQQHPDIRYFLLNRKFQTLLEYPGFDSQLLEWQREGKISLAMSQDQIQLYKINIPLWDNS